MIHITHLLGVLLVLLFFSHASAGHISNLNPKTIKLPQIYYSLSISPPTNPATSLLHPSKQNILKKQ